MRKEREALLVATLAGLVIVGAAAFVVQPGFAVKTQPGPVQYGQALLTSTALPATRIG